MNGRPAHVAVLGSGMAGLAAAAALAPLCERITVFERDASPEERDPRKGVPRPRRPPAGSPRRARSDG